MTTLYCCGECKRLTTMSLCPRCEVETECYAPTRQEMHEAVSSRSAAAARPATAAPLTLGDINVLARGRDAAPPPCIAAAPQEQATPSAVVDALELRVAVLESENADLRTRLEGDRRQMLRSAMDVRDIFASQQRLRDRDVARIAELRSENKRLREKLDQATAAAAHQTHTAQPTAPAPAEPLSSPAHAATPTSPDAAPAPQPSPRVSSEVQTLPDGLPVLQAEVARLRDALAVKTQNLDDLWERAERAERHVRDLLGRLDMLQAITYDEGCNSLRLSQHLDRLGQPPDDIAGFMAVRERSRTPRTTSAFSTYNAPSPFATVGHRDFSKRAETVRGG